MKVSGLILNALSNLKEYEERLEMDEELLEAVFEKLRNAYDLAVTKDV